MSERAVDPTGDSSETGNESSSRISETRLIAILAENRVNKHASECPAAKAYQRMLGMMALGMAVIGIIVWLGQNATEYKIDQAVEKALQRRLPYLSKMAPPTTSMLNSAQAAPKQP